MNLSSEARVILNDPMHYLHMEHNSKGVVDPTCIWKDLHGKYYQETGVLPKESFVKALKSIRKFSSQRGGRGFEKDLIHTSIFEYSKKVCHKFKSLNRLNYHLKGLYGCELPKKFRGQMYDFMVNGVSPTSEEEDAPITEPTTKEVSIGGLKFTLTTGSSLKIGELSTDSVNLQGMKSIKIDKVSEGKLFGVSLEV